MSISSQSWRVRPDWRFRMTQWSVVAVLRTSLIRTTHLKNPPSLRERIWSGKDGVGARRTRRTKGSAWCANDSAHCLLSPLLTIHQQGIDASPPEVDALAGPVNEPGASGASTSGAMLAADASDASLMGFQVCDASHSESIMSCPLTCNTVTHGPRL